MKLNNNSQYALLALLDLAHNSVTSYVNSITLSNRQSIPKDYLQQIMRKLSKAGIVKTKHGPGGGFALAKEPNQITMYDVLVAMDAFKQGRALDACTAEATAVNELIDHTATISAHYLKQSSIDDMLNG